MREVVHVKDYLHSLINVCTTRAESEIDVLMPGYTHLQVRSYPS
jgi:argininosuccinate lyase